MTTKLRIATCPDCGSTKAVEPPGDVGACPYCAPSPAPVQAPIPWRRWLFICAVLGIVAGLLR